MNLLSKKEVLTNYELTDKKLKTMLSEGMPHLKIGNDYRFLEEELDVWVRSYKPLQERLESEFRDKCGRTIAEYEETDSILLKLRITKTKLNALCKKGMPFEIVGKKRFFHFDDLINYFRVGETVKKKKKKEEKEQPKPKENPVLFVIDGSYYERDKMCGAGIVMKKDETITGFTKSKKIKTNISTICEYVAILETLKIIKKKGIKAATIVTDQVLFVKGTNNKKIDVFPWMQQPDVKTVINQLVNLYKEVKDDVTFTYVTTLEGEHDNPLYKTAHKLSRYYRESVIENLTIDHTLPKVKEEKVNTFHLKIDFSKKENEFVYYNIEVNGEKKSTKVNAKTAFHGALLISRNYEKTHRDKQIKIEINSLPDFKEDVKELFECGKEKVKNKVKDMYYQLKEETELLMQNDFEKEILEISSN